MEPQCIDNFFQTVFATLFSLWSCGLLGTKNRAVSSQESSLAYDAENYIILTHFLTITFIITKSLQLSFSRQKVNL